MTTYMGVRGTNFPASAMGIESLDVVAMLDIPCVAQGRGVERPQGHAEATC
jgi:hypothetical protein